MTRHAEATSILLLVVVLAVVGSRFAVPDPLSTEPLVSTKVVITIDDVPGHRKIMLDMTRQDISKAILAALKQNSVRYAYGFANGSFIERDPEDMDVLKRWLAAGYPIGNHTYDHPHLNAVTVETFINSIRRQDQLLARLEGSSPLIGQRRLFRYPYLDEGDTLAKRDAVRAYLAGEGYQIVQVTTHYDDWAWSAAYRRCVEQGNLKAAEWLTDQVARSADRHLRQSKLVAKRLFDRDIPHILVVHFSVFTALTLDAVLKHWRAQGVEFISLEQALADPAYSTNPNYPDECAACPGDHGRPFLEQIAKARGVDTTPLKDSTFTADKLYGICADKSVSP